MLSHFNNSDTENQSKLQSASAMIYRFLTPDPQVLRLCDELGYKWRDRVDYPMITVWMFVIQVISADKSCQRAVARLNAWRVANGLAKVSSNTTSFCKARVRLPEALFERLLGDVASQCEKATGAVNRVAMAAYQGKQTGETSLVRSILHHVLPGRILLADRYYATFWL